jgi:hypothetical protein
LPYSRAFRAGGAAQVGLAHHAEPAGDRLREQGGRPYPAVAVRLDPAAADQVVEEAASPATVVDVDSVGFENSVIGVVVVMRLLCIR